MRWSPLVARSQLAGLCLLFVAGCASPAIRINGSSEEAFHNSHRQLLDSLSPAEKLQLTLAELVYLSPLPCARKQEPIPGQPALTAASGGMVSLVSCRYELDGKSFRDILHIAQITHSTSKVGVLVEPHNSLEPSRDP